MSGGVSERGPAAGRYVAARAGGGKFAEPRVAGRADTRFAAADVSGSRLAAKVRPGPRLTRSGPFRARFSAAPLGRALVANVRRLAARWNRASRVHFAAVRSDRGSATVWSVGAIAVLCVVFGAVLALGQAVVVRHRAAGGADLAALAAADHWADGPVVACARAEDVAREQGVRLVRCVLVGEVSDVTAASGRGPFTAEVRARAGPAGPVLPVPRGAPPPVPPATAP